jgi:hypothetical protein
VNSQKFFEDIGKQFYVLSWFASKLDIPVSKGCFAALARLKTRDREFQELHRMYAELDWKMKN